MIFFPPQRREATKDSQRPLVHHSKAPNFDKVRITINNLGVSMLAANAKKLEKF
jgi:hypothetical protein